MAPQRSAATAAKAAIAASERTKPAPAKPAAEKAARAKAAPADGPKDAGVKKNVTKQASKKSKPAAKKAVPATKQKAKSTKTPASKIASERGGSASSSDESEDASEANESSEVDDGAAAPADDNEVTEDEFRNAQRLCTDVWREIDVTFRGRPASLRVSLRVHRDDLEFSARLGYTAKMYLTQEDAEAVDEDGDPAPAGEHQIGYIHAWRIDKPTARNGHEYKFRWVEEFLQRHPGPKDEHSEDEDPDTEDKVVATGSETAWCLQALYDESGDLIQKHTDLPVEPEAGPSGPRKARTRGQGPVETRTEVQIAEQNARIVQLNDNSLLFIQMVYVFTAYRRQGLIGPCLNIFYQLLGDLPEWFLFRGSVILVPGQPAGARGESYGKRSAANVENILRGVYGKHGYAVWADKVVVRGEKGITVMGRTVPTD